MVELVAVRARPEAPTVKGDPTADKARGPVEVEIVLLDEPVSVTVADVVVPEVPMVADAVAPVPRMAAPVAVRAPFTVAPAEEREIKLVASVTPMEELFICTLLIST